MLSYFAALNCLDKLTPLRFSKLLKFFKGDVEKIWKSEKSGWIEAGIEEKAVREIWNAKEKLEPKVELARLLRLGIKLLPITSENYPNLLKEIYDPPPVLLVRGEFPSLADNYSVAVVGSRVCSLYGRQVTTEITRGLAQAGVTIFSGLALGIDAVAHKTAVDISSRTVAVLGCGLDFIYPPQNRKLASEILDKGGAIISEYPIGTEPTVYNFPQRNRIIAGLSRGVLVTEAREKSGALITAELALENNREVFAVPGSIFSETSTGTNNLIRKGAAHPILNADDILEILNFRNLEDSIKVRKVIADSPKEEVILKVLSKVPTHTDEITRKSGLIASEVGSVLSLLEMKGLANNLGGMNWVKT